MHVHCAARLFIRAGRADGFVIAVAGQKDLHGIAAMQVDGVLLYPRRGTRHVDAGGNAEHPRGERHALGVISGGGRDNAARGFPWSKHCHAIAGSPPLVGFDGRKILALDPDFRSGPAARKNEPFHGRRLAEPVNPLAGKQDFPP